MPGGDRTGPFGRGAITGRGLGMCVTGVNALRYGARAGRSVRRGLGLGPGLGRGLARGLGCGVILGLGYGCARAYGRYLAVNQTEMSEKELLQE
jgi:hypothetical protein